HCRTPAVRIDVQHLPGAIDDHSKFDHLTRAEHSIEMCHRFGIGDVRPGRGSVAVWIHSRQIDDCHWNICHRAIAHCDAFHFARTETFPTTANQTADA